MKWLIFVGVLMTNAALANIIGTWQYAGFIYDGQEYPLPNPNLDLRFSFNENAVSHLKWLYKDQEGFCERVANYEIRSNEYIFQKIIWVNPQNHVSCSKDTDMQLGRESLTHFRTDEDRLMLDLELNGKPFVYILKKIIMNNRD